MVGLDNFGFLIPWLVFGDDGVGGESGPGRKNVCDLAPSKARA